MLLLLQSDKKPLGSKVLIEQHDGQFTLHYNGKKGLPFYLVDQPKINKFYITLNEDNELIFFGRMANGIFISKVEPNRLSWRKVKTFTVYLSGKQLTGLTNPVDIYRKLINRALNEDPLGFYVFYKLENIQSCYDQEEKVLLSNYTRSLDLYGAFSLTTPHYIIYNRREHLKIPINNQFRANLFIAKNKLR